MKLHKSCSNFPHSCWLSWANFTNCYSLFPANHPEIMQQNNNPKVKIKAFESGSMKKWADVELPVPVMDARTLKKNVFECDCQCDDDCVSFCLSAPEFWDWGRDCQSSSTLPVLVQMAVIPRREKCVCCSYETCLCTTTLK